MNFSDCGGTFDQVSGALSSPGYPHMNIRSIDCVYLFKVSSGNALQINILFDLPESGDCNEDYIELRETSESGALLSLLCKGKAESATFSSKAPATWMRYRNHHSSKFILHFEYGNSKK